MSEQVKLSIMAGICIGIGSLGNIIIGGALGSVAFSLGLVLIMNLGYKLFTGETGQVNLWTTAYGMKVLNLRALGTLFLRTLGWNVLGVVLVAALSYATEALDTVALILCRINLPWWKVILRAIGCGIIMDLLVHIWKTKGTFLPVFIGVPLFILSGLLHCIAEPYYFVLALPWLGWVEIFQWLFYWILVVIGNFIGCRVRRMFE